MKAPVETTKSVPVSIKKFKTKDGRDPIAEKVARANEVLQKVGLPDELRKAQ